MSPIEDRGHGEGAVAPLIDKLFRRSSGRLVSSLARAFGADRLDLAEEVVQDAMMRALQTWPFHGVPTDPEGWIYRVARNRAIDLVRKEKRLGDSNNLLGLENLRPAGDSLEMGDDELSMMLMCCHPTLPPDARVALALRTVGGLSTDEIAAAFLTTRTTIQQRIVRAKRTIKEKSLSLDLPSLTTIAERRPSVLAVVYLMFNDGYAPTEGDSLIRGELCWEAVRLGRLLAGHSQISDPGVEALLALMLFQASRLPARGADDGNLILLENQDRTLWNGDLIAEGFSYLERAMAAEQLTTYHVEAGIASCHASAASWDETEWSRIVDYYDVLQVLRPSPVVTLNRAIAVAMDGDPAGASRTLETLDDTAPSGTYHFELARGHLAELEGRIEAAEVHMRRALLACRTTQVRRYVEKRVEGMSRPNPHQSA